MQVFQFLKNILLEIHKKDVLVGLKKGKVLILEYVPEKGLEQDILAKELKDQNLSESFYGYLLWIAGEIMNNVFDHGQTLSRTLKGGILVVNIKDNIAQLAIGDLGIGIKASLEKNPELQEKKLDAQKAIKLSLSEDISGWPYKRGNGLPDVLRIIRAGNGTLVICSDQMVLTIRNKKEDWQKIKENLPGVIVCVELPIKDFQVPRREMPRGKVIKLSQFGIQLSGREKGQEAYEVLVKELADLPKEGVLMIDLSGIIMMNTSFGDQALGVLLEGIKQGHFGAKKVFFIGKINEVVNTCLDRIAEIRRVETIKI